MKRFPLTVTCLAGLLAGLLIGRNAGAGTSTNPSLATPTTAAPTAKPRPDLLTTLKKTPGLRGKTALMLGALSEGHPGDMRHLVAAAGKDFNQLSLLADLALQTDPAGFIAALSQQLPSEDYTGTLAFDFTQRWAKADFAAAFRTCRSLPGFAGAWLGGVVLQTQFDTDPTATLKLAATHPGLRLDWSSKHKIPATSENMELVRALPPSIGKAALIEALSASLTPQQAFALVLEDRYSNPIFGIAKVSQAMVKNDPLASQAWVLANPDHPAATRLAGRISDHLIKTDAAAAVEWATSHLSGANRTNALKKAAEALQKTDPAAADAARALLPEAFKASGKP
ncbi:MAG: hypothetical protein V4675_08490 [Verrucomicrobiota bacterium]